MKIDRQNLTNNAPTFGNLKVGDVFIGTPIDSSYSGVFMKIDENGDFVSADNCNDGLAVDLKDGEIMAFHDSTGVRKVEASLTLS